MKPVERVIDASADRVWSLVGDVQRWGDLLPTMEQVSRVGGDGAVGVGDRFEVRQPSLPTSVYEVTEWRPGRGFTWAASSPGVRTTATHEISVEDGQVRLALGVGWTGPLAGLVRLLLGAKVRRMVEQEADSFARLAVAGDGGRDDVA